MKTFNTRCRGKRCELTFQDSDKGIMLSWLGSVTNLADTLTRKERNNLIIECFNA